jgi:DNA-binding transcriptional ArsR family regulator
MSFTPEPKLTSAAALRALSHPTRLRILSHLQLSGDATATECGLEVGESASSCSYHLRLLAEQGFIEEVPTDDGRERRWHRTITTFDFDAGADRDEEFQAASALARAALVELGDTGVREYLANERAFSPAWREAAAFLQTAIEASPAELVEITKRIQAVLAEFAPSARERKPRGARIVRLTVRAVPKP